METGQVDIVIGTHALIQDDVVFKDLGLLIIDEEHRFGVRQKEKLKSDKGKAGIDAKKDRIITFFNKKNQKNLENGVKIHQKNEEMVPRSVPKATLAASRVEDPQKAWSPTVFGSHLVPLGRFWAPFWPQLHLLYPAPNPYVL